MADNSANDLYDRGQSVNNWINGIRMTAYLPQFFESNFVFTYSYAYDFDTDAEGRMSPLFLCFFILLKGIREMRIQLFC